MAGTRRGDSESRRLLGFVARGIRTSALGTPDGVPVCVADVRAGAAFHCVGFDWIHALRGLLASAFEMGSTGGFGWAGDFAGNPVVPAHYDDRKNFFAVMGRSDCNAAMAGLGRGD